MDYVRGAVAYGRRYACSDVYVPCLKVKIPCSYRNASRDQFAVDCVHNHPVYWEVRFFRVRRIRANLREFSQVVLQWSGAEKLVRATQCEDITESLCWLDVGSTP